MYFFKSHRESNLSAWQFALWPAKYQIVFFPMNHPATCFLFKVLVMDGIPSTMCDLCSFTLRNILCMF